MQAAKYGIREFSQMKVLVINAGSSSLKYQLLDTESGEVMAKGLCERIGIGGMAEVYRAQDTMRLMLLLQGMPFVDLAHLRKVDLKGDLLICRRQKTGTELCVKLMPQARQLIERYRSREESSPYLLDILTPTSFDREAFDDYRRCLRKLNFNLSRLPGLMGMEEVKVSSYTARHTWATLAKYCQVPEEVISEGLGHSSLEVTRTYLKSFEGDELDKANRLIINYIYSGRKTLWNRA